MTARLKLIPIVGVALVGLLALTQDPRPAKAAVTVLCAPSSMQPAAARTILSGAPSGASYVVNGQGCTLVQQADVVWFLSQGFTAGAPFGANILYTTGVATGTTNFLIGTVPPSTYIQHVIVQNTTANAVTGGIAFGTTANGTDIITALACGASCLVYPADSAISKRIFSTTAAQPINAAAVTAWNNANVTISVIFGYF